MNFGEQTGLQVFSIRTSISPLGSQIFASGPAGPV